MSGGGALPGRVGLGDAQQTRFAAAQAGFSIHSVKPGEMSVTFVGAEGQQLYSYTRQRRRNLGKLANGATTRDLRDNASAALKKTKSVRLAACKKRCAQRPCPASSTFLAEA